MKQYDKNIGIFSHNLATSTDIVLSLSSIAFLTIRISQSLWAMNVSILTLSPLARLHSNVMNCSLLAEQLRNLSLDTVHVFLGSRIICIAPLQFCVLLLCSSSFGLLLYPSKIMIHFFYHKLGVSRSQYMLEQFLRIAFQLAM